MSETTSHVRRGIAVLVLLCLAGCASVPERPMPEPPATPVAAYPDTPANGAIFQQQGALMPLFEDRRPARAGDILTIVLNERVSASKDARTSADRNGAASLTLEQLPEALEALAEYGFDVEGASEFTGGGSASANNTLNGTITVMVERILPNGNLRVQGEKQILINQGTEYIRFSGIVNPRNISPRNSVPSTEVAAARIEYVGDGFLNQAQKAGWLQRFFLTVSPF